MGGFSILYLVNIDINETNTSANLSFKTSL